MNFQCSINQFVRISLGSNRSKGERAVPKVNELNIVSQKRDRYPGNHKKVTEGYERIAVGDAMELTQFGVNKVTVAPGASTALNHWHENEDEFVIILSGEVVLVENNNETTLRAGDCAGFKAGEPVGHHLINKSSEMAVLFEVGTRRDNEVVNYPGVDFTYRKVNGIVTFVKKDGSIAT